MCMYFVWKCNALILWLNFFFLAMCVNIYYGISDKTYILLQFDIQYITKNKNECMFQQLHDYYYNNYQMIKTTICI
jgi:hypothetical protein